MSKYDDLVTKLKEIFQIDKPELDFGVYRILNARSAEITDYLENRLKAKVLESISNAGNAESEQVKKDLAEAEKNAANLGVAPENVPKVLELRQKLASYGAGNNEHENAVFTHLLTFFSRYYDNGDFISQRRYKGDTYAIPYAGEEVMLHWANKDQYYTKSGENFSNYAFKLDDGRVVRFKLVTADTAKDNRKDNDKERRFALIDAQIRTLLDDEGDEVEETLLPITEETNLEGTQELVIRFEYKAYPKGTKQETLSDQAIKTILEHESVKARWLDLSKREPTEKNPSRTLLEKCLTNYTSKNTADYFIHKDLGGFLKRELDFYIKNEVMHLDDVQHAQAFADIEKNLRMIQTLRSIAQDIITFLAQLEDFQKKLWLKKKFVVSTHYCITLDRIDEALYPQIAANPKQWEQWQQLGMLEGSIPTGDAAIAHLKAYPFLMVDTALFDAEFKFSLLKQADAIDEKLNGLLIHGDNFQALQIIRKNFEKKIGCVYIDPPYNAPNSEIAYKNNFKHSSFLSLVENRLSISSTLTNEYGSHVIAIDKNEKNGKPLVF
jgi:adenine-specific DNA-methyltransferase